MSARPSILVSILAALAALPACSGEKSPDRDEPYVIRSERFTVGPGEEVTKCQTIHSGTSGFDFRRVESHMVAGSHHLILYRDASELAGNPPPAEGLTDCEMSLQNPRLYIYSSQTAENDTVMPEGVYGEIDPDTVFILELHFANATSEPIEAFAEVTIFPEQKGEDDVYSGILFFMNNDFVIPAGAGVGDTPPHVDEAVCEVPRNVNVFRAQSHTHWRGLRVEGWHEAGGALTSRKIYKNEDWHAPVAREFVDPVLAMAEGDQVRFACTWQNPGTEAVEFGPSVDDEMCILGLGYYPRVSGLLRGNVFCFDGQVYF